jgi:hypothetical protein
MKQHEIWRRKREGNIKRQSYVQPKCPVLLVAGLGGLFTVANLAAAAVHYVDLNSPDPAPPYTSWASAARVIQDTVDAATAGDAVVVTNVIYATGRRAVYGSLTNRAAVEPI